MKLKLRLHYNSRYLEASHRYIAQLRLRWHFKKIITTEKDKEIDLQSLVSFVVVSPKYCPEALVSFVFP